MGRFFRTTTPQNVDFMYQLPENLMFKATQQASEDITQNQTAMFSLYDKLKLEALNGDKPRAKQILAGYEDQVNQISQQLQEDPLAFRRRSGEITNLARTIQKDFTTGEAAAIGANYQAYVEMLKNTQEAVKSKRVTDVTSVNPFISTQLKNFGSTKYNPVTGEYNKFSPDELVGTYDIEGELAKNAKEMVAQKISTASAITKDGYIFESGGTRVVKTMQDLMMDAVNSISLNPQAMQFLRQRDEIGAMSGWVNENGGLNVQKDSPFYNLATTIADRFDQDDTINAYKRLKNDSQTGGAANRSKSGLVVDRNNVVINRPTIAGVNTAVIDRTKPETHPITQQNNQIQALEEAKPLILIDAAKKTAEFIAANNGLTEKEGAFISSLAEEGKIDELKEFAKSKGVTPEIINDAVYQIESASIQQEVIRANRDMFMSQAMKSIGLTETDSLSKFDEKRILQIANDAMMNQEVNATKTVSVLQTNGDFFEGTDRKVVENVTADIKADAAAGVYPPTLFVSEINNGKVTVQKMTNQQFQDHLKKTRSTTAASTSNNAYDLAETKAGKTTYKPKKDITVNKVLDDITADNGETMSKPFSIDYGDNLTVYIPAETYPSKDLGEVLAKNGNMIEIRKAIKDLNILATSGRKSTEKFFRDQKFKPFTAPLLNDHIDYTPPVEDGGVGYITFKYDEPIKVNGKLLKRVTLPANDKNALLEAEKILNNR